MAIDDLKNIAMGWIKSWNKGKLQKKLKETAQVALDERLKNIELETKIGQLQDEINRLKGEKPRPKFKKARAQELETSKKKKHSKHSKAQALQIDEEVVVDVEEELPKDAKFIGTRKVVVQDLKFERKNTAFVIKRYYSSSLGKVIEGNLPEGVGGSEFGPDLVSFIVYQYYKNRVPHRKIQQILRDIGVQISAGSISSILTKVPDEFVEDLDSATKAGLKKCPYIHLDETGAKLSGVNWYTFGVSNPYFTRFKTLERKKRDGVAEFLGEVGSGPPVRFLISDDAPNFKNLIKNHQLCWVHEIRKYKLCEIYKQIEFKTLNKLLEQWRKFYKLLKRYRANRSKELKARIEVEFDRITSIKTLVRPLDDQLGRTRKLKNLLLMFLRYPQIPIQNNPIERDLRERVIKRKISMQNRSRKGVWAWDVMLSLASTCDKLGLSFWSYLKDRLGKREEIPYLGKLINSL